MKHVVTVCSEGSICIHGSVWPPKGEEYRKRKETFKGDFQNILRLSDKRVLDVEVLWFNAVWFRMVSAGAYLLVPPSVITKGVCNRASIVVGVGKPWLCFYVAYVILEVNLSCLQSKMK